MAANSFLNLAFLSFYSVSLLLVLPFQPFAASRGRFLPNYDADNGALPLTAICSAAVTLNGYKCQEFDVTTDDGYVLSVLRIPEGRAGGGGPNRPPVLLQHGVLVDGMTWLVNPTEESLATILADNGFDVWISNVRGTRFSRRHLTLDSNNSQFWNWTWDDLVTHDLQSVIELVFQQTGQKTHYVGHSMGTLMAMVSLSEGKFDKVKSAALLCPIAYLTHITTALGVVAAKAFLGEIIATFGLAEFNLKGQAVAIFLKTLCTYPGVNCYDLLPAFTGNNCCLNASTVETFLKNEPQSTATKNLVHFAQSVRNGVLSKYDYGNATANMEHYGVSKPPVYDLSKIPHDFPIFLSYGGQDALSDVKDVRILLDILKSHDQDKMKVQYIEKYAHADFIMGVDAKDIVYNEIIEFFRTHN
ncbi:Triacylglycerol lipase 2 [Sesamum alatum]|uniref:Lipase n=1 Tax=Sesamum alatum TaxID=300844 RepID=A0AAE2CD79_9LAMI|nr:Triacylglycerol lipase 2 [Sesamum alatum]